MYIKIIHYVASFPPLIFCLLRNTFYISCTVFHSFKGLFIKIGFLLGNSDRYVGNLCGLFNLVVRLNAHGVLSVIHDSLISAGVINVYEQSVSVKQISRSVNYSPFWDLCKSQWRNSGVCCVSVIFQQLEFHLSSLLISSAEHESACSLLHTRAFIPHWGAVAAMVG